MRTKPIIINDSVQKMPSSPDMEKSVIGELLCSNYLYGQHDDILTESLFYDGRNRLIFSCVRDVIQSGRDANIITVSQYAESRYPDESIGVVELMEMQSKALDFQFERFVSYLYDLQRRRDLWMLYMSKAKQVLDMSESTDGIIDDSISGITSCRSRVGNNGVIDAKTALSRLSERVTQNATQDSPQGYMTGFRMLDENYGLQPDTLTVIAAFTSVGKTSLSLNIAVNLATRDIPNAYYSLEMGALELWARILSVDMRMKSMDIMHKPLSSHQQERFQEVVTSKETFPIYIDENATISFERMLRSIRELKQKYDIKVVFVDYLQIFSQREKTESSEENLGAMARACKNIAKELHIAVVLLSQLNRSGGMRHPSLSQLRGSGQIAEAADNVLLIDRPEAQTDWVNPSYKGEFARESTHNTALLLYDKGRNIGKNACLVNFTPELTLFSDVNSQTYQQNDIPF